MRIGRSNNPAGKTQVVVLTADAGFEEQVRLTFGASEQIVLRVVSGTLAGMESNLALEGATVAVVDLDAGRQEEMQALERLMARVGTWPPVIVLTQSFDESVARTLLQMRVADFMVKPVSPVELVRTCARVAKGPTATEATEAQIYTFLPAVGGAGVTTLALQSAMLLLNSGERGKSSTCLVDLDFQHGACADYLDLEPRLNLGEIEPRPERLDRQLLEVMLSHHPTGLAGIAARSPRRTGRRKCARSIRMWSPACSIWSLLISTMSCSTCRAPGFLGPTACCSAPTSCSSSAK